MTTGRINQVACRAPRRHTQNTRALAKPAAPPTQRPRAERTTRYKRTREVLPTRTRFFPEAHPTRRRRLQHVRAQLMCVFSDGPTRASFENDAQAESPPQTDAPRENKRHRPRQTERPLRPAKHSLAASGAQPFPFPNRSLDDARFCRIARARAKRAHEQWSNRRRSNSRDSSKREAAATSEPWCAGPTRRNLKTDFFMKNPSRSRRAARCTRRFASNACDKPRNHSPNQRIQARDEHAHAKRALQSKGASLRCARSRGCRSPNPKATRSRAPRGSRCQR